MKNNEKRKYILGIETSGIVCSIALIDMKGLLIEKHNLDTNLSHSVELFVAIEKMFRNNNMNTSNLECIRVSVGPGSFTGLRIGVACALGLSIKHNIKIEYVDTLYSLYEGTNIDCSGRYDFVIPMINAKCNRVYMSVIERKTGKVFFKDGVINIDFLIENLNKYFTDKNITFLFTGDGSDAYLWYLKDNLTIKYKINKFFKCDAEYVANAIGVSSEAPYINYILPSQAERNLNNKKL